MWRPDNKERKPASHFCKFIIAYVASGTRNGDRGCCIIRTPNPADQRLSQLVLQQVTFQITEPAYYGRMVLFGLRPDELLQTRTAENEAAARAVGEY
jgi:hypothetical protein